MFLQPEAHHSLFHVHQSNFHYWIDLYLHLLIYILHWCAGLPVEASPNLKLQRLQGTSAATAVVGGLKLVLLLIALGLLPNQLQDPCILQAFHNTSSQPFQWDSHKPIVWCSLQVSLESYWNAFRDAAGSIPHSVKSFSIDLLHDYEENFSFSTSLLRMQQDKRLKGRSVMTVSFPIASSSLSIPDLGGVTIILQ